jgi:hypothetical protein
MKALLGSLVIAHGLVTIAIWSPNPRTAAADAPMDTSHSWLLGDARGPALALALIAGLTIVLSGIAYLGGQSWWSIAGIAGGGLSLVLFALYFTPWWSAGIAISAALIYAAAQAARV